MAKFYWILLINCSTKQNNMKNALLLFLAMSVSVVLYGQRTVSGTVTDVDGEPPIGANVTVVGEEGYGTITDFDGFFELQVPESAEMLDVSYIGYQALRLELGEPNEYEVNLEESGVVMDEVVVVAYGEQTRRSLVSSVSILDDKAVNNIPAVSPQEVLQGQASGVQIVQSSGVLGAATNIRIRGVASLSAGGQPLFVVDGVPLNDGSSGDYSNDFGGATTLNPLMNISMEDIESMSVLKDAAATSLYGSRGSNGVVLINTKQGKAGQNNVTFNTSYGVGGPTDLYDMTNSEEYYEISERYTGDPAPEDPNFFDWQDAVTQQAQAFKANLGFDGGDDKTRYYIGGAYTDDQNYIFGNDMEKYTGKMNLSHQVNDNFKIGANLSISRVTMDRINQENSTFAPLTSAYLQPPFVDAFNEDGSYARTGFIANVLAINDIGLSEFITRRTFGNAFLNYTIPNVGAGSIQIRSDWGIDEFQTEETIRWPEEISPGGYGYRRVIRDDKWLTTNTINYSSPIGERSNFSILFGQSFETALFQGTTVEGSGFAADPLRNVASAANPSITSATRTEWALASFFGRAQYDFDDRFFVEASIRRDGSSRFGANNRWGNFWSVGGGWNLINESFMQDQGFFDELKLRASYGTTGNQSIDNFESLGLFGAGVVSDYNGSPGLRPIQPANPDLKWEQTAQFDIGVNMRIKNFFDLGVSFWNKETTDLLLPFTVPMSTGFTSIFRNAGDMTNTGVDIDYNFDVLRNKDWYISIGVNLSFWRNEINNLPDASVDPDGNQFIPGSASQRAVVGRTANEFFLIRYNGINSETGDAEWLTKDGELTTSPQQADRVFVGSAIPDFIGGVNFNVGYKGLNLSGLFNYTYGNLIMLDDLRFTENPASGFNRSTRLLDAWEQPGDDAFAPGGDSPTFSNFAQRSTNQLMDGSFLRLRTLTLSYDLPVSSLGIDWIKNLSVYARGNNLLTITASDFRGQDPEVSDSGVNNLIQGESFFVVPQRKMYTFGINVTF